MKPTALLVLALLGGCATVAPVETKEQFAVKKMCFNIGLFAFASATRRDEGWSKEYLLSRVDTTSSRSDMAAGLIEYLYGTGAWMTPYALKTMYQEQCIKNSPKQ